ncbi:hypothetical protein [Nocardioides panacis]|nr:hypothetical protein [Nocardioides panacis]
MSRPGRTAAALLVLALAVAGCSTAPRDASTPAAPASASAAPHATHAAVASPSARPKPLRAGERRVTLAMPAAYTPSAPYGTGTDDYRCFVLDPHLRQDAFITGLNILPGTPDVVHHVILFRVPPESVPAVQAQDASEKGQGWTCFGGTGLDSPGGSLDDAPWLGAWAPGGSEQVMAPDVGVPVRKGSRVIMQVHYNLLAGPRPDVSATQLRLAPASAGLHPLETMLLPAPVELPCRSGHTQSLLCDRATAVADVQKRFGDEVGQTANYLHLLCGQVQAGPVQACDRKVTEPATIRAVAGHMHLLGRSIRIEVDPGTPRARTVLDVPVWDFDNQGAKAVRPVPLRRGDTVRVTCRHDQRLRDRLPAFRGRPERYVVWGEGTTDEMCLGILLVTRP